MNLLIESMLDELSRFEYTDDSPGTTTFNGLAAPKKDSMHGEYHQKLIKLASNFRNGVSQFQFSQGIQKMDTPAIVSQLEDLVKRIDLVIERKEVKSATGKWIKAQKHLGSPDATNSQQLRSLKFLIDAASAQNHFASDAKDYVKGFIKALLNPKPPRQPKTEPEPIFKFTLTEYYSNPNNMWVLTDLRNKLVESKFLKKEDVNSSHKNFRRLFQSYDKTGGNGNPEPIKWHGYESELKYFIKKIKGVLITTGNNLSNNKIAFELFVDTDGNPFKPKTLRLKGTVAKAHIIDDAVKFLKPIEIKKKSPDTTKKV